MNGTHPWRCGRCHRRLVWSATTVGCPHCRTIVTLPTRTEEQDPYR